MSDITAEETTTLIIRKINTGYEHSSNKSSSMEPINEFTDKFLKSRIALTFQSCYLSSALLQMEANASVPVKLGLDIELRTLNAELRTRKNARVALGALFNVRRWMLDVGCSF